MTFADFIHTKRTERDLTLRGFAAILGVSPAFISDVEKGRRFPGSELMQTIASVLQLSEDDTVLMYDLAAQDRGGVPDDIIRLLVENPNRWDEVRELLKGEAALNFFP